MVARAVLVLGPLVCAWAQLEPFSQSRALIGDAAAPVLVVVFGLALIGPARGRPGESSRQDHGVAAWVRLAAEKPGVVAILVLAALLGNAPLGALNPAILLTGIACLAAGACRRITGGGDDFAARLDVLGGIALLAAAITFANLADRFHLPIDGSIGWLGFAVLPLCLLLLLRSRSVNPLDGGSSSIWSRGRLVLTYPTLFLMVTPVVIEIPRDLDFTVYAGLPATWLALTAVGMLVRTAAARCGRLVEHSGAISLGRRITIPTQAWCWILAVQLAARMAHSWGSLGTFVLATALLVVTIGFGVELGHRERDAGPTRSLPWLERALIPLLAPTLAFAILHTATIHASWNTDVASRGQVALLLEALPVPLLGAALVVAFAIDRASGRPAHAAIAALGLALFGGCLMTFVDPVRFEPFIAWFGTPEQIAYLGQRDVYGPITVLVAVSTAICVLRIVAAARGRRPSLLVLVVPVLGAFAAACMPSSAAGPTAATWTAIVGLGAWLPFEAWSALRTTRSVTTA